MENVNGGCMPFGKEQHIWYSRAILWKGLTKYSFVQPQRSSKGSSGQHSGGGGGRQDSLHIKVGQGHHLGSVLLNYIVFVISCWSSPDMEIRECVKMTFLCWTFSEVMGLDCHFVLFISAGVKHSSQNWFPWVASSYQKYFKFNRP